MILIGPKPFPPALHLLCRKAYSNKDGLSLYGVTVQQKTNFYRRNPIYFHHTFFNFEGKKLIVKKLFIKPLLV